MRKLLEDFVKRTRELT